jgi:hypothetical protein
VGDPATLRGTRAASDEAFERYVVPESRNVPRSTLTRQGRIDFRADHPPMLFVAAFVLDWVAALEP